MIRVQLISKRSGKSLTIRNADPIGINDLTVILKRSAENDGVVRQIVIDLPFIKLGRTFLKTEFEQWGGPDAEVVCNIYAYDPNNYVWSLYATGQVNFSNYELTEDRLTVDVEQTGFQRAVENSLDVPVALNTEVDSFGKPIPANPPIDLPLHAKAISRTFQKIGREEVTHETDNGTFNLIVGTGIGALALPDLQERYYIKGEINTVYELVTGVVNDDPTLDKLYFLSVETGGSYRIKADTRLTFTSDPINDIDLTAQRKLVYGQPGAYTTINMGAAAVGPGNGTLLSEQNFDVTLDLVAGDKVYFYVAVTASEAIGPTAIKYAIETFGNYALGATLLRIEALTKAPESTTKAHLMFEAVRQAVRYATGQDDCFKSNLLGRTDLGYSEDGAGSLVATTNGNCIRKRDKNITHTLASLIGINNALHAVGIGYETDAAGTQRLVLEAKDHFYNKNLLALDLGPVYNVERRLDPNRLYNQVKFGFNSKIALDQINAVDAFNTIRSYKLPLRNSKNTLDISTTVKADGYQIEYQRSLINSTNDGKLDDENFIISLFREAENFKPKKNEGYDEILGAIDPASGYNYDFAPGRCLRNWLKYLASSLIYSEDKTATFAGGESNYELSTRKTGEVVNVKENDPVSLFGFVPLWKPFIMTFEARKLSRASFQALIQNQFGYVKFSDLDGNKMEGYILEVSHNPTTKSANFQLLEVYR